MIAIPADRETPPPDDPDPSRTLHGTIIPPLIATGDPGRRCAVYLHYDGDGALLYVGVTDEFAVRSSQHAAGSTWVDFAKRGEMRWCDGRAEAEWLEKSLIRWLKPLFNAKHAAPGRDARLVAYLVGKGRLDLLAPAISRG